MALLMGRDVTIADGLGGMYLHDELGRGASGTMTGFAYPQVRVSIWACEPYYWCDVASGWPAHPLDYLSLMLHLTNVRAW